ncbi:MAG: ABC transporter ATP-binding protein [bacterium]
MSGMRAIRAESLTRRFGSFTAVDRIDFEVARGEVFGLLGANGAGKTTTIRMLTGLLRPSEGEAWVAGIPVHREPERVKEQIGYMSQRFSLYEDLTVAENLTFFGGVYGLAGPRLARRRDELLETFGMVGERKRLTASLPAGLKQRLALASALIHEPLLLFLDEPTAAVDPVARRTFWQVIARLASGGTTVLVTTHYMDEAEYCHRVAIMRRGIIADIGTPGALREGHGAVSMEEVFLDLVGGEEGA